MENHTNVKESDILMSDKANKAWYVRQITNGNMILIPLFESNQTTIHTSTTFANSCHIYRKID
jgi:hypothetical protein